MAKLSEFELKERLITILKDVTGEKVKPEIKLDDFYFALDIEDIIDLCMSLEKLGYDFDNSFNICIAHLDGTVAELAFYLTYDK